MTPKVADFLRREALPTPCLVVDLDIIEANYRRLARLMPSATIYYAVKANPAAPVLDRLVGLGSRFDVASLVEIEACIASGADPRLMSYGSTVKKVSDIARARALGVDLYAFDSEAELDKLVAHAPGARVFCRIAVGNHGARWPLSEKFGCSVAMAADLLVEAKRRGLDPVGLSFHVGSQQVDPVTWDVAIARSAMLFTDLADRGIELKMLNLGGGFPVRYREPVPTLDAVARDVHAALNRRFGNRLPELMIEPGRAIAGTAGVIRSEVVLVARKDYGRPERWIYLDAGKFGGLAEASGDAIDYPFRTRHDGGPAGPVVIVGPTCDGADVLYDANAGYELPLALAPGDTVDIIGTGAYTTTYASIGFNGFGPLKEYYI